MRIGLNLLFLRPGDVGGSETYITNLATGLAELSDVEVTVFASRRTRENLDLGNSVSVIDFGGHAEYSILRRLYWENVSVARRLSTVDVLYSPGNYAAPFLPSPVPQVVMVHDLQHLLLPWNFSRVKRLQRSTMFRLTFRRARHVITPSEFTRQDVIGGYGVPAERVSTVLHGAPPCGPFASGVIGQGRRFGRNRPFLIYPAHDFPHKNHGNLIRSFQRLVEERGHDVDLVLTGQTGKRWGGIEAEVRRRGLDERVHHLGFIDHGDVLQLIRSAAALVFPSGFEGFGLPLLEAMACGTPVLASDVSCIPEIAGDGAYLIDPGDESAWVVGMDRVLSDPQLAQQLVTRGRANLARFSWRKCVAETRSVLERVSHCRE